MNLSEVNPLVWLTLAWAAGLFVRVLWPYVLARINSEEPLSFDWRYMIGQVIGALLAYAPVWLAADFADQLGALGIIGSFGAGYGGASFGRNVHKTGSTIRK